MSTQETIERLAKDQGRIAALTIHNIQAVAAIGATMQATSALVAQLAKAQGIDTSAADASLAETETALNALSTAADNAGVPAAATPTPAAPAAGDTAQTKTES